MRLRPNASPLAPAMTRRTSWGLPELFIAAQVIGPAILYLPGTQPFRVVLRMGVFALGLIGLVLGSRQPVAARHPSRPFLMVTIGYLMLMVLHPETNTIKSGLAQVGLNLAVIAPLFWAPRYFHGDHQRLARVLTIIWLTNGASVLVGILQVRDPATWMPAEFSSVVLAGRNGIAMHEYRTDDGRTVVRPPGLGDSPGSACNAGLLLAAMGLAYLVLPSSATRKVLGIAGAVAGVTVIFLTHVRSSLIVLVASLVVFVGVLIAQKRHGAALSLLAAAVVGGVLAIGYASTLGGRSTVDRFATLVDDDPMAVLDKSARLGMTLQAFDTYLLDNPLGAGLGRHGMMRLYFGTEDNPNSPSIWAEVQFASWVLDGGIVMVVLYPVALIVAIRQLVGTAVSHPTFITRQWAGTIIMLSVSPITLLISYCPFDAQFGMQFWFLIGAMDGVAIGGRMDAPSVRPRSPAGSTRLVPEALIP